MLVSVVIATLNRRPSLEKLLDSLAAAQYPDSMAIEILVVDNGSNDGTLEMLSRRPQLAPQSSLKVFEERERGKANALNRGLASSKGDLLLFLDDDVVADPGCFAKHGEVYESTPFDAVQGKILPGCGPLGELADLRRIREYNIPYVDYGEHLREIRSLTGANMSFKRRVFEDVGCFDPRLGPGAAGLGEDTEYSIRIRKAGFKIGYTPHAIVYHELNPNRYGRKFNRMVEYRKGLSRSIYRRDSIPLRLVPNLLANCMRYGLYRLVGATQKAATTEGRIMKYWGHLVGKARGVSSPDTHSEV